MHHVFFLRNLCLTILQRFSLMCSSRSFIISAVTCRSMIHFKLVFCELCMANVEGNFFLYEYIVDQASVVENTILPLNYHGFLVKH